MNGVWPFAQDIFHLLQIHEAPDGTATVDFLQASTYPALEIWQYGGPGGPTLVYYYDAAGKTFFDLSEVEVLVAPK